MCSTDTPEMPTPAAPAEVLTQSAPVKKTSQNKPGNALAIGTKKYRTETGLGSSMAAGVTPMGQPNVTGAMRP